MPGKNTSVHTPAHIHNPSASPEAISHAVAVFDANIVGRDMVEQLRSVLFAIRELSLSDKNGTIHKLAKVGCYLAEDFHNSLDCEVEEARGNLNALKGAGHA